MIDEEDVESREFGESGQSDMEKWKLKKMSTHLCLNGRF